MGFAPASIFRSNAIAADNGSPEDVSACAVFTQSLDEIDEVSKK